jgi:DNA-binding SARP family transcriptional activator
VRLAPLESGRAESLLAYLLLHRDAPQPRQRLSFLLWPDSTEAQARTNLRHVLHRLRRALPDADRFLDVTPRTLQWRPDGPFRLDLAAFEDALDRAAAHGGDAAVGALREAADAYAGDLVEGSYDEWLLEERDRLRERYAAALERLCGLLESTGRHAEAIGYAERLVAHDPLREDAYRLLMRLHDARGDRARALRAYHACAAALQRDLRIEPSAETRAAYERLVPGVPTPTGEPESDRLGDPVLVGRAPERRALTELWRNAERGRAHRCS